MIKIRIIFLTFLTGTLFSCTDMDKHYFKGDIRQVNDRSVITKNIKSELVPLGDVHTGMAVAAYDSLLICWSPRASDNFFNVFNVDTGEKLGSFCAKGRGNKEIISAGCIYQFFKKENDLMTLVYAHDRKMLFIWNISKSIERGKTVYDTILPHDNNRILWQFYHSKDILFDYKSSVEEGEYKVSTPYYEKRTINTNELVQDYPLYNTKTVCNSLASRPLYSWDAIKPDGSKIVQVMRYFPQINILDTHDCKLIGYRTKTNPNFSLLDKKIESADIYYTHVHADNHYIYAICQGKESGNGDKSPHFNTIHIFDWEGNMKYKLITDQPYSNVWADPIRKRLYTLNMNTEKIHFFDLAELN